MKNAQDIHWAPRREKIIPRLDHHFIRSSRPIMGQACLWSEKSFYSSVSWTLIIWKPPFKFLWCHLDMCAHISATDSHCQHPQTETILRWLLLYNMFITIMEVVNERRLHLKLDLLRILSAHIRCGYLSFLTEVIWPSFCEPVHQHWVTLCRPAICWGMFSFPTTLINF